MKRRHLYLVIAFLSVLLTISMILLAVAYRNGSSRNAFDVEIKSDLDTSRCNISAQIARDLRESAMLFIADQSEFADLSRQTVVDFLDHWSTVQPGDFEDGLRGLEKIAVVLEIDSIALRRAGEYMETWDYEDIAVAAHMRDTNFTTADLEFFWRIGNIRHRLNAARVRDDWWNRVALEIIAMPAVSGAGSEADSVESARSGRRTNQLSQIAPGDEAHRLLRCASSLSNPAVILWNSLDVDVGRT